MFIDWLFSLTAILFLLPGLRASSVEESLQWVPRSNLYFGLRPQIPESLMVGLMWYNSDGIEGIQHTRHSVDMFDDNDGWGWLNYDPRVGGTHFVNDNSNQVKITCHYVKKGNSWSVKVEGEPYIEGGKTTLVFYAGLEGRGKLNLDSKLEVEGIDGPVILRGESPDLGTFMLTVDDEKYNNSYPESSHALAKVSPSSNFHYASLTMPAGVIWKAKEVYLTLVQDGLNKLQGVYENDPDRANIPPFVFYTLPNANSDMSGNVHLMQKTFEGKFSLDITFGGLDAGDDLFESSKEVFKQKVNSAFKVNAPFDTPEYVNFTDEIVSNLLGGISYFYGKSLVDREGDFDEEDEGFWLETEEKLKTGNTRAQEEGPFELFTSVPSRSHFPRGFLWDEGFQLIPIFAYDQDLAMKIFESWFSLVDESGWIAREQILGEEARSRVPVEFRVQFPHYANPPTLLMLLTEIVQNAASSQKDHSQADSIQTKNSLINDENRDEILGKSFGTNKDAFLEYANSIYPKLQAHYNWYRRTQKGDIREWDREAFSGKEGYRWRGQTPGRCLTSGIDDYPRAEIPHTGDLHVDLLSWIGMMSRSMKNLAIALGKEEDAQEYEKNEIAAIRNLDDLHWNEKEKCYCDLTIDEYEESAYVTHKGYVSLMPFSLKLIPVDSAHLVDVVEMIRNPDELWTDFGLRSLSLSDKYHGSGEDYWRGPIWMNMNYLALDALKYYSESSSDPALKKLSAQVYHDLRVNLINNIYKNWKETHIFWESYQDSDGHGKGAKQFLGWTSLAVKIMGMPEYLDVNTVDEAEVKTSLDTETPVHTEL